MNIATAKKAGWKGTPGMPVPSTMSNKSSTKFAIQALLSIMTPTTYHFFQILEA
jgi:hypothetical protein